LDVALDGLEVESGFCSIGALTFTVDARINYSTVLDIWMNIFPTFIYYHPPPYIHPSIKKNPTTQPIHPLHLLLSRNSTNPPPSIILPPTSQKAKQETTPAGFEPALPKKIDV